MKLYKTGGHSVTTTNKLTQLQKFLLLLHKQMRFGEAPEYNEKLIVCHRHLWAPATHYLTGDKPDSSQILVTWSTDSGRSHTAWEIPWHSITA